MDAAGFYSPTNEEMEVAAAATAAAASNPPYMSKHPLTCILHALNNYLGEDRYTANPISRPRTFTEFHELFITIAPPEIITLLVIPAHVFHALTLAHIPLPPHIFAIRGSHIYNYVKADKGKWWHIDSTAGTSKLVHIVEIGLGDNLLIFPLTADEKQLARLALLRWIPSICNGRGYYHDIKMKLLKQL